MENLRKVMDMGQLLKWVYAVHKDIVEGQSHIAKERQAEIERLQGRLEDIQRENAALVVENKRLMTLLSTGHASRLAGMTSSMRPTDHSPDSTSRLNVKVTPEHKFQQQVKVTPDRKVKVTAVDIQSEDDLVFDRDPEETFDIQRSKLKRKRGRRSRYCEEVSPELKRQKQLLSHSDVDSTKHHTTVKEKVNKVLHRETRHTQLIGSLRGDQNVLVADTVEPDLDTSLLSHGLLFGSNQAAGSTHKSTSVSGSWGTVKKSTVKPGEVENITVDKASAGESGTDNKLKKKLNKKVGFDNTVVCVPETMAMDFDDGLVDNDDDIGVDSKGSHVLSLIDEVDEEMDATDAKRENIEVEKDSKHSGTLADSFQHYKDENRKGGSDKEVEGLSFSLRSVLQSPETVNGKCVGKAEKDMELNSLKIDRYETDSHKDVCSSDSEENEQQSSQTFGRTKKLSQQSSSQNWLNIKGGKSCSPGRGYRKGGNVCRTMTEVNALFETPDGKSSRSISSTPDDSRPAVKPGTNVGKKPNFKSVAQEVILRRSPRKHRTLVPYKNQESPSKPEKTSKDVNISSGCRKEEGTGEMEGLKETKTSLEQDPDMTVAPEPAETRVTEPDTCADSRLRPETLSQSMDVYHVVPVTDGVLNSSKKFQVVTSKRKEMKTSKTEVHGDRQFVGTSGKGLAVMGSQGTDLVTAGSPSVGSVSSPGSDFESPLILKTSKMNSNCVTPKVGAENVGGEKGMPEWKSKNQKERLRCQSVNTRVSSRNLRSSGAGRARASSQNAMLKSGVRNKVYTVSVDKKTRSKGSRTLHQTTLTQAFFSPKKSGKNKPISLDSDGDDDYDHDDVAVGGSDENGVFCDREAEHIKLAVKHSLEEDNRKTTLVDEDFEIDQPFKHPSVLPKRETLSKKETSYNLEDTDGPLNRVEKKDSESEKDETVEAAGRELLERSGLNGSLDPAAELSEWCRGPETLDIDFCPGDLAPSSQSLPRTSTLAMEDSQDIPSTSTSYKFPVRRKPTIRNKENIDPSPEKRDNLDDSFDRLPRKRETSLAHVAVVRKRDERQKLQGHGCKQCMEYYKAAGCNPEEMKDHIDKCSRHRAQYVPPETPPHFWSVDFMDTQDCPPTVEMEEDPEAPKYRRRKRLNKYFRSKNENSEMEEDSQDLEFE